MNSVQELWWRQARSDFAVFETLRRNNVDPCHLLHYLQMATEKLGKAYLWRSGKPLLMTHARFVSFIRALADRSESELPRIAKTLGFSGSKEFRAWARADLRLAYDLQKVSPALASDGPNCEYPWPYAAPTECPVGYIFSVWEELRNTGRGRKLMQFIRKAILSFDEIA